MVTLGYGLIIVCLFLWMAVVAVVSLVRFVLSRFTNKEHLALFALCVATISFTVFAPFPFSTSVFQSKVVERACYEGTQSKTYILFRGNGRFEINATGAFGMNEWWLGRWRRTGDTIELDFNKEVYSPTGTKVVIADSLLVPWSHRNDTSFEKSALFSVGYCKGEN